MSQTPPDTPLDALTLVIASQRSGSTLLCRDIASLGGMGAPREHFLDILRQDDAPPDEAAILGAIGQGVQAGAPGIGAVKLMVSYASRIDAGLRGGDPVGPGRALQNVVAWARERFARVNLVALVRTDPVEQAISRVVAQRTDVWHREARAADKPAPAIEMKGLNPLILGELPAVIRQTETITGLARADPEACLLLRYETLARAPAETSARLVAHARAAGFEPERELAERSLRKLIDAETTQEIKTAFRGYLERRLKLWN